jgi:hypothetical protein
MKNRNRVDDRCQVSVRGKIYDRIKLEAERRGVKVSQIVEEAVQPVLDLAEAQAVDSPPGEG